MCVSDILRINSIRPFVILAFVLLSACVNQHKQTEQDQSILEKSFPSTLSSTSNVSSAYAQSATQSSSQIQNTPYTATTHGGTQRQPEIYMGTGELVQAVQPRTTMVESESGDITLNFEATPISEAVGIILGDYLNQNFTIDSGINGGLVTLRSGRPLRKSDLIGTLETLLVDHNAVLLKDGDLYRVMPLDKARTSSLPILASGSASSAKAGFQSVIVPLRFISALEMEKILKAYQANITINERRNLMIVSGARGQIDQIMQTIKTFDVDWLKGMSVGLFPLNNASPEVMAAELQNIMGQEPGQISAGLIRMIPIERLNSILVVTSQPAYLSRVDGWVNRLDRQAGNMATSLYIYHVQNGRAADLALVLEDIFSNQIQPSHSGIFNSLSPSRISSDDEQYNDIPTIDNSYSVTTTEIAGSNGGVRITADEVNNALLIKARKQDYKMIVSALKELDVAPLQVLIETTIVEVRLTDQFRYGLEWFFRSQNGGTRGEGLLDLGNSGLSSVTPGFSYLIRRADEVRGALNALAEDSKIEVLSSPSLMVLNNQTATIRVGDQVPLPTRQSTSNIDPNAPTVNEIEYRNTGVLLSVTPRVNSSGTITMDITQEVSNVTETTSSDIDAPTILQRQIDSTIAIDSGFTVVLGGLIREEQQNGESGVPYFYKIPVLGKLFGQTNKSSVRTELVALITPRIIRNASDANGVTEEFRRKMLGLTPINTLQ